MRHAVGESSIPLALERDVVRVDRRRAGAAEALGDLAAVVGAVGKDLREDVEQRRLVGVAVR